MSKMPSTTVLSVITYSLCSGSMLLVNKLAIYHVKGCPTLVSATQIAASAIFVLLLKYSKIAPVDDFTWKNVKPYLYYVVAFVLGVWTNMKSLSVSNVDTVIVFRSCTPLAVALLDWWFLGRELPGRRSCAALCLLLVGAAGYVMVDASFALQGLAAYYWVSAYFFLICFEMTYGKKIVSTVKLDTVSGSVLYTNFFGWLPMLLIGLSMGEAEKMAELEWTQPAIQFLALSCALGTGISYAGWWCRGQISATSFTLVGVVNKILTVLLNVFVWDKHASPQGIAFLMLCLVGGGLYKQAPMRNKPEPPAAPKYQLVPQDLNGRSPRALVQQP